MYVSTSSITLQMGITPKVFGDTLPNASIPYFITKVSDGYQLANESLSVIITLTELPPRVIAGLTLPITKVDLHFTDHTEQDIEKFILRFRRYFHRGGG